ncbi:hypothetical protein M569_02903, partial [Genlisea aurea]
KPIRVVTFNAALFSMAPAVPEDDGGISSNTLESEFQNLDSPRSILKNSPLHHLNVHTHKFSKSGLRVSINLPDNEISLRRSGNLSFDGSFSESARRSLKGKGPVRSISVDYGGHEHSTRTILEVLRDLDADLLALQDVRAEEEKNMKPLSDLADALGMKFVFAESWAPDYGNAILSKWPIRRWKAVKICDDSDFRNVLKATIDVPEAGEINLFCTVLDHLDENWRMKQVDAIIGASAGVPHILAGTLNSLDQTDYSHQRWTDIVK